MTLSLRGNSIPTNGSGHVLITDINLNGGSNEDALICQSGKLISGDGVGDWYLHPTEMGTDESDRIMSDRIMSDILDRGWYRNRTIDSQGHRLAILKRDSATAEEGVFTCDIPGDFGTPVSVGVYYSSES